MSKTEIEFPLETTVFAALELSKGSWLLAIHSTDRSQPSMHHIKGGDVAGLLTRLNRASEQHKLRTRKEAKVVVCFEAGYDGLWLARWLEEHDVRCFVIDASSLEVNRRARRPKTDRIDAAKLVRTLMAWCRGERDACSMVRVPSREDEDLRRSHRERSRLVRERTAHINRIKGLLFAYGVRITNIRYRCDKIKLDELLTGDGHPLPPRLRSELDREIVRLKLVKQQIAEVEKERDEADASCSKSEAIRHRLIKLRGIGPAFAAILTREVYYRSFENRRQVGSYIGLTPSPHDSGQSETCRGISKSGNAMARSVMIEAAWLWLKHQPSSRLSQWYQQRTAGHVGRIRRIMIVALARKLAVAFWRFLERGTIPDGAICAGLPRA